MRAAEPSRDELRGKAVSTACANPAPNARNPNLTLSRSEEPRAENQQSLEFPPRSHVCGYSTRTRFRTEPPAALLGCDRVLGAAAGLRTAPAQHRGARRGGERRRGSRRLLQDCAGGCLRAARSISPARRPRSPGAGPPPAQGRGGEARPERRAARRPRPPEGRAGRRRRWERAAGSARERRRRRRREGGIEQSAAQAARRRGCQPREEQPPPPPDSTITSHGEGKGPAMRSRTRSRPARPSGLPLPPAGLWGPKLLRPHRCPQSPGGSAASASPRAAPCVCVDVRRVGVGIPSNSVSVLEGGRLLGPNVPGCSCPSCSSVRGALPKGK